MPIKTKAVRPETGGAKVLLFDVETSPNIGYTWGVWEQNVIEIIKPRQIICFSWKWLGEKKTNVLSLTDFPGYKRDRDNNKELIEALHAIISKADIVVGHNIDGFDDRRANTDFIKHGLTPPPPHRTVDTLRVARSKFDFNSNKLNDLGAFLKLGQKVKHSGFELWKGCVNGEAKAWALMRKYNKGDVDLLERVYLKVRPWMAAHPNMNIGDKPSSCTVCRSHNMKPKGHRYTNTGRNQRYQCGDCGKWAVVSKIRKEYRLR